MSEIKLINDTELLYPSTPEEHKQQIIEEFSELFSAKYTIGQCEHGGKLWNKNNGPMLLDEALDFISYLFTQRLHYKYIELLLEEGFNTNNMHPISKALSLLKYGNVEGTKEEGN